MYCINAIKYSILWYVFHHVPPSVTISDRLYSVLGPKLLKEQFGHNALQWRVAILV